MNTDPNIKQQELQFLSIIMLTSKNGNQQFLLLNAQIHFDNELQKLTLPLDTLRLCFQTDNNNQQSDILRLIDELIYHFEQMHTQL
ncbi:unnamed protein product [Rotaria sp. Silwood1]|nr:unnamed protein product [Rotaria sp. Silwood1]CAF4905205.1 unnamed protein product [Rotaria sp. Silwood1]CAF5037324.1 unnamed protein product [Rotaria sp. Silwood1]CAF5111964.1 unnamed protein product [Rotaria sp. Silwood1]